MKANESWKYSIPYRSYPPSLRLLWIAHRIHCILHNRGNPHRWRASKYCILSNIRNTCFFWAALLHTKTTWIHITNNKLAPLKIASRHLLHHLEFTANEPWKHTILHISNPTCFCLLRTTFRPHHTRNRYDFQYRRKFSAYLFYNIHSYGNLGLAILPSKNARHSMSRA